MNNITHLSLSGGGTKGLCALGILQYLDEKCLLKNVKQIIGTSIGSVIGTLLCFMSPHEIINNIELFYKISYNDINIRSLITKYSLMTKEPFINEIEFFLQKYFKCSPSFSELFLKTGKHLIITASNITTHKTEYFDHHKFSNMKVIDAIKCSINIPIIFEKEIIDNNVYIDGSVFNNFEWNIFNDINDNNKIGILLKTKYVEKNTSTSLFGYIINIIEACFSVMQKNTKKINHANIFHIENDVPFFDLHYNEDKCMAMIKIGRDYAKCTLKN